MGISQRLARTGDIADRIPAWDEFAGPQAGVVELPNRLYWSGVPAFDVENAPRRLTLYTTLIGDGQRADLARWINRDLLVGELAEDPDADCPCARAGMGKPAARTGYGLTRAAWTRSITNWPGSPSMLPLTSGSSSPVDTRSVPMA